MRESARETQRVRKRTSVVTAAIYLYTFIPSSIPRLVVGPSQKITGSLSSNPTLGCTIPSAEDKRKCSHIATNTEREGKREGVRERARMRERERARERERMHCHAALTYKSANPTLLQSVFFFFSCVQR